MVHDAVSEKFASTFLVLFFPTELLEIILARKKICSWTLAKFIKSSVYLGEYLEADLRRRAGSTHEIYDVAQRPHVNTVFTEFL